MSKTRKSGGCGCSGGKRRKTMRRHPKRGGTMVGDALLAGTAYGLYSFFTKKGTSRGGAKGRRDHGKLPRRKSSLAPGEGRRLRRY